MTPKSLSRLRRLATGLLAAALLAAPPAGAQLPALGETSDISSAAERRLGERIARELYRDPDYIDDPVLVEYVQGIWQPLMAAARKRGDLAGEIEERFAWQVLLGKDRSINAFALPGGWLGLHLGLVSVTTSADELASVLAHELSHVTQRHIARLVTQQNQQTPLVIAGMILGALAAGADPQAGGAIMHGSQALAAQNQLNFSRDMEREADRIGLGVLETAGFEPHGFVTMFEKLGQAARLNDSGNYPYLRTHPMTTERIADMQARQQLANRSPARTTLEHAMVSARARVISHGAVDALRSAVAQAQAAGLASQPKTQQAGALYAGTLAASRLRDAATSSALLGRLEALVAGDAQAERQARLLGAELALAAGDNARVLRLVDLESRRRPDLLFGSQAQVRTGQAAEAAQRLQTWVATNPRDATAWQMLSSAYTAQGQALRAIRAEAEARVAHLDYTAALDRLKAAQDLVRRGGGGGDHIEASIIDTRARQMESLLREEALER